MPEESRRLEKTATASRWLNISPGYLKLQMEEKGGPLLNGVHYFLGPTTRSAIQWDVAACREIFNRRGMLQRKGEQVLRQLQNMEA